MDNSMEGREGGRGAERVGGEERGGAEGGKGREGEG